MVGIKRVRNSGHPFPPQNSELVAQSWQKETKARGLRLKQAFYLQPRCSRQSFPRLLGFRPTGWFLVPARLCPLTFSQQTVRSHLLSHIQNEILARNRKFMPVLLNANSSAVEASFSAAQTVVWPDLSNRAVLHVAFMIHSRPFQNASKPYINRTILSIQICIFS